MLGKMMYGGDAGGVPRSILLDWQRKVAEDSGREGFESPGVSRLLSGEPIGMSPGQIEAGLRAALAAGDRRAGMLLGMMGGPCVGAVAGRSRAVVREPTRMEFCDACDREIGGPPESRCACNDPPPAIRPGPSPLALEVEGSHPSGIAAARKLAYAAFAPYELNLARESMAAHGGARAVFVDGAIDDGSAFHVLRMMDAARATGAKAIALNFRSEGGQVAAGLAIVRALDRLRADHVATVGIVSHRADSMASVLAASCHYTVIDPFATMTIHEASGGREEHLAILRSELLDIYEARTFLPRATLQGYLSAAITFDAFGAVQDGLADEVATPERAEAVVRQAAAVGGICGSSIAATPDGRPLAYSFRQEVLRRRAAGRG